MSMRSYLHLLYPASHRRVVSIFSIIVISSLLILPFFFDFNIESRLSYNLDSGSAPTKAKTPSTTPLFQNYTYQQFNGVKTSASSFGYKQRATNCLNILQSGKYVSPHTDPAPSSWQPENCVLKSYHNVATISDCLRPGDHFIFFGDSTARQIFWAMAYLLDNSIHPDFYVHENEHVTRNGVTISLFWDPYLNLTEAWGNVCDFAKNGNTAAAASQWPTSLNLDPSYKPKTYLFTTTGLWHAMFESKFRVMDCYKKTIDDFIDLMANRVEGSFDKVFFAPTLLPYFPLLDEGRKRGIAQPIMREILEYTDAKFNYVRDKDGQPRKKSLGLTFKNRLKHKEINKNEDSIRQGDAHTEDSDQDFENNQHHYHQEEHSEENNSEEEHPEEEHPEEERSEEEASEEDQHSEESQNDDDSDDNNNNNNEHDWDEDNSEQDSENEDNSYGEHKDEHNTFNEKVRRSDVPASTSYSDVEPDYPDLDNIHPNDISIYYVPVFNEFGGSLNLGNYDEIGLHYVNSVTYLQASILLNHICNERTVDPTQLPHTATCCVPYSPPNKPSLDDLFQATGGDRENGIKPQEPDMDDFEGLHQKYNRLKEWNSWSTLNTHLRPFSNRNRNRARLLSPDGRILPPWNQTTGRGYIYGDGTGDYFTNLEQVTNASDFSRAKNSPDFNLFQYHENEDRNISLFPKFPPPDPYHKHDTFTYYSGLLDVGILTTFIFWFFSSFGQSDSDGSSSSFGFLYSSFIVKHASKALLTSIFKSFILTGSMALIAAYAHHCDRTQNVSKTPRYFSQLELFTISQIWILGSLCTVALGVAGYRVTYSKSESDHAFYNVGDNKVELEESGTDSSSSTLFSETFVSSTSSLLKRSDTSQPFSVSLSPEILQEFKGLLVSILLISKVSGLEIIKDRYEGHLLTKFIEGCWILVELLDFCLECNRISSQDSSGKRDNFFVLRSIFHSCLLPAILTITLSASSSRSTQPSFYFFYHIAVKVVIWKCYAVLIYSILNLPAEFEWSLINEFIPNIGLRSWFTRSGNASTNQSLSHRVQILRQVLMYWLTYLILFCYKTSEELHPIHTAAETFFPAMRPNSISPGLDIVGHLSEEAMVDSTPAQYIYPHCITSHAEAFITLLKEDFWIIIAVISISWLFTSYIVNPLNVEDDEPLNSEKQPSLSYHDSLEVDNSSYLGIASSWSLPSPRAVALSAFFLFSIPTFLFFSGHFTGSLQLPFSSEVYTGTWTPVQYMRQTVVGKPITIGGGSFIDHLGKVIINSTYPVVLDIAESEQRTLFKIMEMRRFGYTERFNAFWYSLSVILFVSSWIVVRLFILENTKRRITKNDTEVFRYIGLWSSFGDMSYELLMLLPHTLLAGDGTTRLFVLGQLGLGTGTVMSDAVIQIYIRRAVGARIGTWLMDYYTYISVKEAVRNVIGLSATAGSYLLAAYLARKVYKKTFGVE